MRIGLLIDTLAMGGAEHVAVLTACELSRLGNDVTLVCYHPRNDFEELLRNSRVRTIMLNARGVRRWRKLRQVILESDFSVIHALKAPCAIWGLSASLGSNSSRWFVGHHALTSEPWAVRNLCRWLGSNLCGWIVPSAATAAVVRNDYGAQDSIVHVVHNPINLAVFSRQNDIAEAKRELGIPPTVMVVTMVANLHPWKNYSQFLRVAQRIQRERDNVLFISAGRDFMNGIVQAQCIAMGLENSVRFLGHHSNVARVFEATDVAIITSNQEAFCLALAEAGAMEVACISTTNGGAAEVLEAGRTGLLVPVGDDEGFAAQILGLLDDPRRREIMGRAAWERVSREFSVAHVSQILEEIYVGDPEPTDVA